MISGSTWMVAMRWAVRGIGVVSTVVLVRLLAPEDFGLVAIGSLFLSFLTVLTSFGVDMALIQRADTDDAHYSTAWTIRALQTAFVALSVYLVAPFAATYFDEPRVRGLMQLMSVGVLIGGFENIGIVNFRKDLLFSREFTFLVATKVGSFIVTITLAFWLRNYWALAWGVISFRFIAVVLSFVMHPYRPRLDLSRFADLWSFSQWMLLRNIGMYLRKQIDTFLVARTFGTDNVGYYSISKEVSELPTTEIIWPMARALFPGYAKLAHDPVRLGAAFLKVLNTIALIAIPAGIGIARIAEPLVNVVFGDRWLPVVPAMSWLSVYGAVLTISSSVQAPLIALGHMRMVAAIVWVQLIVVVPAIVYAVNHGDITLVAQAQFAVSIVLLPVFFFALTSLKVIRWAEVYQALWRPASAGLAMFAVTSTIPSIWFSSPVYELAAIIPIGAIVFICIDMLLWIVSKRPDGGETAILEILGSNIAFFRRIAR